MKEKDELRGHKFDGIEEYDNDLPRWWLNIFWVTTIFAIGYTAWVHLGFRPSDHDRLAAQLEELKSKREESAGNVTEESLALLVGSEGALTKGKTIFAEKCAACHADKGQGLIGPNLTDPFWIHGGDLMSIREVILKGVPEKGMISWESLLTSDEVGSVVAFIGSIRNTNIEGGKAPEGEEYTGS